MAFSSLPTSYKIVKQTCNRSIRRPVSYFVYFLIKFRYPSLQSAQFETSLIELKVQFLH